MRLLPILAMLTMLLCAPGQASDARVERRVAAEGSWDVVVRTAPPALVPSNDGRFFWSAAQPIEVLFENRSDPRQTVPIVSEPGPNNDCNARIERMTSRVLVVSCVGEKWTTYENHEFLYDPHTRRLIRREVYMPFGAVESRPEGMILGQVGDGGKEFVRVTIDAASQPRVTGAATAPAEPESDAGFGAFHLARQKNRYGSEYSVIAENGKFYPLQQSDQATWLAARPDDAKSFLHLDQAEMNEEIGPHQWVDGNLWFGKTFYNSEGATGVGGFGYFDTARREYKLYAPPEIVRWSVSAMLVEADAVWLALYRRGEYGNYPGGILRWDRQSGTVRQIAMDQIGVAIARLGGVLTIGTTDGVAVLRGDAVTSYLVDRSLDGKWELTARNLPR